MSLTPEEVRNKRFTPVRLREGYDMGEVDQFLDEVESELERLAGEGADLRGRLDAAANGQAGTAPSPQQPAEQQGDPEGQSRPAPAVPTSIGEASTAAVRLLEIATRNADEVLSEARDQADTVLAGARSEAERVDQQSRDKVDQVESDARARAEELAVETAERRQRMFGELERDRDTLSGEVEHLRAFERECRSRLKAYFSAQLAELEGEGAGSEPGSDGADDHQPQRLRSLLVEDQDPDRA